MRLLNGERARLHYTLRHRLVSLIFRIEWFGAVQRHVLSRGHKQMHSLLKMRPFLPCPEHLV